MIDEYEKKHYPIGTPDPIEAIKIRMEEMQLKQVAQRAGKEMPAFRTRQGLRFLSPLGG